MKRPSYIISSSFITITFGEDGFSATIYESQPKYHTIKQALRDGDFKLARELVEPKKQVEAAMERYHGNARLEDGVVYYNDEPIHTVLTERILEMVDDGFNVDAMMRFLDNLMENSSFRAVNELYRFLESSKLPITEDGHFLAYKRVDNNYKDIFTHKIDNSVGATVEVPRNKVNEDCNQTCAEGLHFCAREYLPQYGISHGNRTVMVKINPRDVVAIPKDYNNAKGRCCRYVVIRELDHRDEERLEKSFYPLEEDELEDGFDGEDFDDLLDEVEQQLEDEVGEIMDEIERRTKPFVQDHIPPEVMSKVVSATGTSAPTPTPTKDRGVAKLDEHKIVRAIFPSVSSATEKTGVDGSSIRKVCNGKRNTAGGFRWCWADEISTKANKRILDEDDASREPDDSDDFWVERAKEEAFHKSTF